MAKRAITRLAHGSAIQLSLLGRARAAYFAQMSTEGKMRHHAGGGDGWHKLKLKWTYEHEHFLDLARQLGELL